MIINTLCVFGTRPEAIKMAPLIKRFQENPNIHNKICVTGQHFQLLTSVLNLFKIEPDFNLQVMSANQDLCHLTSKILNGLAEIFKVYKPQLVLVHGDTTTALAAALAAYYHRIPVAHIEAGLRTGNIYSPWPEEANRKLAGSLAVLHFAPTEHSRLNLLREGAPADSIHVTGNTVIDALYEMVERLETESELITKFQKEFPFMSNGLKTILVTGHRRENFGIGFDRICQAILQIAKQFPNVNIVYPIHLNPNVQGPVKSILKDVNNIYLIDPVDYLPFIYLMKNSYLILTDSGGIQEEAPALGKPVLVMRDTIERPEALAVGCVKLVGADIEKIVQGVTQLLTDNALYQKMSQTLNPYGDGKTSKRIVDIIRKFYSYQHPEYENQTQEESVL